MRFLFRIISIVLVIGLGLVTVKFVWARYVKGQKDISLDNVLLETKNSLLAKTGLVDRELGKVLGETDTKKAIGLYAQDRIQKSEVIGQIKEEINNITASGSSQLKDLPSAELKKIRRSVSEEICKQLLKDN